MLIQAVRPYTPTTAPNVEDKLELMIKNYPNGLVSSHVFSLKVGDELSFKGPIAKFKYTANEFDVSFFKFIELEKKEAKEKS